MVLPRRKVSACITIVLPALVAGLMKCTFKSTETPGAIAPSESSDIMAIVVMESTRVAAKPACRNPARFVCSVSRSNSATAFPDPALTICT